MSITFVSCSQDDSTEEDDKTFINDPRQPGVGIGDGNSVRGVFDVKICPNRLDPSCPESSLTEFNKVELSWRIPSLYENEEYIIAIYKVQATGANANINIGEMPDLSAIQYEEVRLKDTEWTDTGILQNENYHYWIYLVLEGSEESFDISRGFWSDSNRYEVLTPLDEATVDVPEGADFWENIRWDNLTGAPTGDPEVITYNTFKPGSPDIQNPKGRVETAYNGAVVFIADTDKNRILVYENAQLRSCEQFLNDELQYFGCRLGADGAPPTAHNILGQPSQNSVLSCQEHNNICETYANENDCNLTRNGVDSFCKWENNSCKVQGNKCLTQPSDLLFNDGKLYVSDSGNDRIMIYENVLYSPIANTTEQVLIGCDKRLPNQAQDTNPVRCQADRYFGRQSFDDFSQYSLENGEGISMLDNPSAMAIDGTDFYIADTGNNRIVKINNYNDPDEYICNSSTWLTSLCSWDALLGQANYSSKKTFNDFFFEDPSILSGTFNNELNARPDLLRRYCANPNKIIFKELDGNKYMFVSCNENFQANVGLGSQVGLKARIIRYNENPIGDNFICNEATFDSGNCDADEVYGQETFEKVIVLSGSSGGAGSYDSLAYTFNYAADIDFVEDSLMVVDSTRNNIYVWRDLLNKPTDGFPYTYSVEDPEGRFISASRSLPNLKEIQGIRYDGISRIYVTDGQDGKVYQLNIQTIPFE